MNSKQTFAVTVLLAVAGNVFSVAAPALSIGRFSFDYEIAGDGRSRPIQVFDNGAKTYLQYSAGVDVPAFFSPNGDQHFVPTQEGPYAVIAGAPRDLIAQMGLSRTRITHASLATSAARNERERRNTAELTPVGRLRDQPAPNAWTDNSYAQPRRGDHIIWTQGSQSANLKDQKVLFIKGEARINPDAAKAVTALAKRIPSNAQVTVVGRDDDSYKEGLAEARARSLREALVRAGVAREQIQERAAAPDEAETTKRGTQTLVASVVRWSEPTVTEIRSPVPSVPVVGPTPIAKAAGPVTWQVRASDGTVEGMLKRWASVSGWQVLNKGAPEVKVTGDAEFVMPDFVKAADFAIVQARTVGYRIKATAYSNNVLVITEEVN